MKTTGTTVDGNYTVEMTPQEHRALSELAEVTEGEKLDYLSLIREISIDLDLSSVIGAIYHFVTVKDNINRVLNAAKRVDELLMGTKDKSEGDKLVEFFGGDND